MDRIFTQTFAVAGALIEDRGKILLIKENLPGDPDDGKWSHPAGWIDVGENPLEAAKREVAEESGYEFKPESLLGIYSVVRRDLKEFRGAVPHAIKIIYRGKPGNWSKSSLLGDAAESKWFQASEIISMADGVLRDPDIKQMVADLISGKGYPLQTITHTLSPDTKAAGNGL